MCVCALSAQPCYTHTTHNAVNLLLQLEDLRVYHAFKLNANFEYAYARACSRTRSRSITFFGVYYVACITPKHTLCLHLETHINNFIFRSLIHSYAFQYFFMYTLHSFTVALIYVRMYAQHRQSFGIKLSRKLSCEMNTPYKIHAVR